MEELFDEAMLDRSATDTSVLATEEESTYDLSGNIHPNAYHHIPCLESFNQPNPPGVIIVDIKSKSSQRRGATNSRQHLSMLNKASLGKGSRFKDS